MARIAYMNGQYRSLSTPMVQVEDRGFQFSDGVYEVCLVVDGLLWDAKGHFERWRRSLSELSIPEPMNETSMRLVCRKLLNKNRLRTALLYLQATRGVAPRNHVFKSEGLRPSLSLTARPFNLDAWNTRARKGVAVQIHDDIRWGRVDIKSISLLPNVLAKKTASDGGAAEAWLCKDGAITEGSSSNAWIVNNDGTLVTHPKGNSILGGITRESVIACARDLQMKVEERPFSIEEVDEAQEAFITSATNLVTPVVQIDDRKVGDGTPGSHALRLRDAYIDRCKREGETL